MITLDYAYLSSILPDTARRTPIRLDWLKLISSSLQYSHNEIKDALKEWMYAAAHNYQVASIENLINTTFTLTSPAYIVDGNWIEKVYLSLIGEEFIAPVYIHTISEDSDEVYLYGTNEASDITDFYVIIDESDIDLAGTISSLIKGFAQGGKKYLVTTNN